MSDRFRGCARSLTAVAAAVLATGSPNVFAQSRAPLPVDQRNTKRNTNGHVKNNLLDFYWPAQSAGEDGIQRFLHSSGA